MQPLRRTSDRVNAVCGARGCPVSLRIALIIDLANDKGQNYRVMEDFSEFSGLALEGSIEIDSIFPVNTSGAFSDLFTGTHSAVGKVALKRPRGDCYDEAVMDVSDNRMVILTMTLTTSIIIGHSASTQRLAYGCCLNTLAFCNFWAFMTLME